MNGTWRSFVGNEFATAANISWMKVCTYAIQMIQNGPFVPRFNADSEKRWFTKTGSSQTQGICFLESKETL